MTDRVTNLGKPALPNPPALGNSTFHKPAKASHVDQILLAQDTTLTPGRRVIMAEGMRGNPRHQCTDIDIADGDTAQPVFENTYSRTVGRIEGHPITPGHVLRIEARCIPSGPTGNTVGGLTEYTGDTGRVRVQVTWDDGTTTETITTDLQFDANASDYGHGVDLAGSGFTQLQEKTALNFPPAMLFDYGEVTQWSQSGVRVDIKISYIGGIRPVDVVVYEQPYKISRDDGAPAGPAHLYQSGENIIPAYPLEYPAEGASSGDRRFGSNYALDVASASQVQTGPSILYMSSHSGGREPDAGVPQSFLISSTSGFAPLDYAAPVSSGETPSLDFSSGTFGREFQSSHEAATGDTGVCRVRVSAYWRAKGGGETRMQFKTALWSLAEVATTSSSFVWTHAYAYLECGQTVLDKHQLEVLGEVDSGSTGEVKYVSVCWAPE